METASILGHPCFADPRAAEAFDLLPVGVAVWSLEGRALALNRKGAEVWGVPRLGEGAAPQVLAIEAGADPREHPVLALLRGGREAEERRLLLARADGGMVPIRSRLRLLRDVLGAPTAVIDTFEREEPPAASASARLGRAYSEIADALPFVMWTTDAEGAPASCNRCYWDYCGVDRESVPPDWTNALHSEDRPRVRTLWMQAVASGAAFRTEVRLRRFDGTHHWFLTKAWPVRDDAGAVAYWLGTCTNIDEIKRLELELRRCNEELASFASIASHDLREPLRMVANFLDLLRKRAGTALDVTSLEYLAFAHDGARRMQELVRKLLDYSRIGRIAAPSQPVDAAAVARDAVQNLTRAIEDCGASVTIQPLPAVRVERMQLMQLLQNLLANALKYRSSASPVVELSAERDGGEWSFRIRDNGIGIAKHEQQRIFGLFQRVHGEYERPGAGIGLAVCKKIVENHGGRIWVNSEPGKGACFQFTLPA